MVHTCLLSLLTRRVDGRVSATDEEVLTVDVPDRSNNVDEGWWFSSGPLWSCCDQLHLVMSLRPRSNIMSSKLVWPRQMATLFAFASDVDQPNGSCLVFIPAILGEGFTPVTLERTGKVVVDLVE
ncbi:hypothetical protein FS842_011402 [Serendipita sp. 407]|nr:hypothetical protein FS842_011402 [Serendipita sp. 407]